ncbi:MAG: HDIG domain-containing metalloprotein [Nanoarchaeota archaeon]
MEEINCKMPGKKLPITREEAIELLKSMDQKESDWNHYLESEVIMKALAEKLDEDVNYWSMLGLLHDTDWALTKDNWKEHSIKATEILKEKGFDNEFIEIIQSHAYGDREIPYLENKNRTKKIEHALASAETITGLIYAYALMRGKNISDMDASGLKKKFKDKRFAENCNREIIKEIENVGISLDEFFDLSIKAIQNIKNQIGLI